MARKPRIHLPRGVYHVMLRGNGGQRIFFSDGDYHYLYGLLEEGTERFGYRVHTFCCMPNHLHLGLQAGEIPLSRAMQNVSFRYTRRVNRNRRRVGHLFQGRYKAILVDRDSYLLELVRYIHLNPVRARLVEDAMDYTWSGHRAYMGKESLPWLTTDWVLGQFGDRVGVARSRYQRFVRKGVDEGHRAEFHAGSSDTRVLGDEPFTRGVVSWDQQFVASTVSLDRLVGVVCQDYGLSEEAIAAPGQGRRVSAVRATVGWLAAELRCATLVEVGRRTNQEASSVSSAIRRLTERAGRDRELADRLEGLRRRVLANIAGFQA